MTILCNIYGGPGSGKSTSAAGVFSLLKTHGVNAELVTEFAKDLVWEGRDVTLDNQPYILEVKQNPDISEDAGLAAMAKAAGYSYTELINKIINSAKKDDNKE